MQVLLISFLLCACIAPLIAIAADTVADIEVLAASLDSPPLQFRVRAQPAAASAGPSSANATEFDPTWIAAAHARFTDSRAAGTGWYGLTLTIADALAASGARSPLVNDSVAMAAAGFGEGALTGELVCSALQNFGAQQPSPPLQAKLDAWFDAWWDWMRGDFAQYRDQAAADDGAESSSSPSTKEDDLLYHTHVQLVLDQLEGVRRGYNAYLASLSPPSAVCAPLTIARLLQLSADTMDIVAALTPPAQRTQWTHLTRERAAIEAARATHCSALIRLRQSSAATGATGAGTRAVDELSAGHATWNVFSGMLRIAKTTDFALAGAAARVMRFSSAPGYIFSGDDWYTLPDTGLLVMETTNNVFDAALYDRLRARGTVISFLRALVANRLAATPAQWCEIFARFNSGTNNNQWMALAGMRGGADAKVSLWISEQLPGLILAADVTHVLRARGFWPSYNVPYLPRIFNASGYPAMVARFGDLYSYDRCPRALIFARNATRVQSLDELGALMRYNAWQTDALSLRSPANAVASRFDLLSAAAGGMPMGAIDAKTTDRHMFSAGGDGAVGTGTSARAGSTSARAGNYRLVSGPTAEQQTPFAWSTCPFGAQWPHVGQPDRFDFAWTEADGLLG